jgi:Protein of unknown function (DUF3348)
MVHTPQRSAFSGPTLIRLLARLTDADLPESAQSLPDRLSQWLDWTDAIALSTALNGSPPAQAIGARENSLAKEADCARVRTALVDVIARDGAGAARRRRSGHAHPLDTAVDYPAFRQHYLSMQQAMETAIGQLRERLRAALAATTPGMARLAAVDAVMERALGLRERSLLATVPGVLGGHFERLRRGHEALLAEPQAAGEAAAVTPGAWLDTFRKDMQSVMLAELELRFQPVEGLLAALRTR